jgi:hypothetical protein
MLACHLYALATRGKILGARRETGAFLDPHALPRFGGAFVWQVGNSYYQTPPQREAGSKHHI